MRPVGADGACVVLPILGPKHRNPQTRSLGR